MSVHKRMLGKSDLAVNPLGLGCMRLSSRGWYRPDGIEIDFGQVDEAEAKHALREALDLGITVFDTASLYGAGHNEKLLGEVLGDRRDEVVIISKAGGYFDEKKRRITGKHLITEDPRDVKEFCEGSLRRLKTDHIDIYLLHTFYRDDKIDLDAAAVVRDAMEELVSEGKLRWYGWSTDWPHQIAVFAEGAHCIATEQDFNVRAGNEQTLAFCEAQGLTSFCRRPLGEGLVSSKKEGADKTTENAEQIAAIREILRSGGRSVVQGALCWLWARSPITVPLPGFRTLEQMRGLAGALEFDPLSNDQMIEIEELKRKFERT